MEREDRIEGILTHFERQYRRLIDQITKGADEIEQGKIHQQKL